MSLEVLSQVLPGISSKLGKGLSLKRFFTREGTHPYGEISWEERTAFIKNAKGEIIFEQTGVEVPSFWSQSATDIVAEKYFSGHIGKTGRESSVRELVSRVADTITGWGRMSGYFQGESDEKIFNEELTHILVNQKGAFNSPVWFNVGAEAKPQCSACFILEVQDNKESIAEWYRTEMFIFSGGSGAGLNVSNIRSSKELLTRKGKASGPISFMKGADAIAGTIKSGGKNRRAAKMVILNADHPDIKDFIICKWHEEEKAKTLIAAGYDDAIDGDVYNNVFFQNANNSVRATDEFMRAVENDGAWELKTVRTGEVTERLGARDLMQLISEAAWHCADPGMQFDTVINKWHTCPVTGRINGSNPCSEYMHLDNSACNLASINLMKFVDEAGEFDLEGFRQTIKIFIISQDIIVGHSSYPTEKIAKNAVAYRQLGLGYANLGALLMYKGLPYDSEEGRTWTGALTSILTGEAYLTSTYLAEAVGPFAGYEKNREPMLNVLKMHGEEAEKISGKYLPPEIWDAANTCWLAAYERGEVHGVRNSQATVLAPTGTISFMMDCDTTGIEPAFSLVAYKKMVGGGFLKMVNKTVGPALRNLGYGETTTTDIINYISEHDTIEGAPHLKTEHLAVFDCAVSAPGRERAIHYLGHVRMMAAAQPFISGAISKTVNLPASVTIEDIAQTYLESWRLGLKAIAVYRDGSKGAQPLNTGRGVLKKEEGSKEYAAEKDLRRDDDGRHRLPADVVSWRHKFSVAGHEGYIHYGVYDDGRLGEIFIRMAKEGSTISGLLDSIGILMSVALQYGVPVKTLVKKTIHSRFEPSGYTDNSDIVVAKSILDYIAKFLAIKFLSAEDQMAMGIYVNKSLEENGLAHVEPAPKKETAPKAALVKELQSPLVFSFADAPACRCGAIMVRTGSCYTCPSCGENLGACS
ncbi:MAG: vitamin B12-dependent ribonucleotide reductase [bacterium]|nr:vitamin B12-dependent ribonucleotide reductase [bacterium]